MGHSTLIIEAMKVTLVLCATLALASSQGCPELAPVTCGKDMMNCPGMNDVNGCPTAGSCMPTKGGPVGTDGVACPVMCSSALHPCGADMMACPVMGPNGCQQPDLCLPAKGATGTDGTECTVMCPLAPKRWSDVLKHLPMAAQCPNFAYQQLQDAQHQLHELICNYIFLMRHHED